MTKNFKSRVLPFLMIAAAACADTSGDTDTPDENLSAAQAEDLSEVEEPYVAFDDSELADGEEEETEIEPTGHLFNAAAKGAGVGASLEVALDINKWTDQMNGWLKKKSNSDHYHDLKDKWVFFEGNHCSQNVVGSMWTQNHGKFRGSIKGRAWFVNDEARSVLIRAGRKGEIVKVADDSAGTTKDDWAHVLVKKSFNGGYCVGTFETSYEDAYVKITYGRKNGLDGKISWVSNY